MDLRNGSLQSSIASEEKKTAACIDSEEKVLHGRIVAGKSDLAGRITTEDKMLCGRVNRRIDHLEAEIPGTLEFHYSTDNVPEYTGPYEVVPKVDAQTLETAGKRMRSDVEVEAVPYFEVSNTAGGSTVYIAKELT